MTSGSGLLHLFVEWSNGAVILAGTGVPPANPVPTGPRFVVVCDECPTWVIGGDEAEASARLVSHKGRCHG